MRGGGGLELKLGPVGGSKYDFFLCWGTGVGGGGESHNQMYDLTGG